MNQVARLLDRYLEAVASMGDDDEREMFYLALDAIPPSELFSFLTAQTARLLRSNVLRVPLVITLKLRLRD